MPGPRAGLRTEAIADRTGRSEVPDGRCRVGSDNRPQGARGQMATEPVHDTDPTIGRLVSDASRDISSLISNEIQLAKSELQAQRSGRRHRHRACSPRPRSSLVMALIMLSVAIAYLIHWNGDGLRPAVGVPDRLRLLPRWSPRSSAFVGVRKVQKVRARRSAIAAGRADQADPQRGDPSGFGPERGAGAGTDRRSSLTPRSPAVDTAPRADPAAGGGLADLLRPTARSRCRCWSPTPRTRRRPRGRRSRRPGRRSCRAGSAPRSDSTSRITVPSP